MANRAKTLLSTMAVPTSVTSSSSFGVNTPDIAANRIVGQAGNGWISQIPAVFSEWIRFTFASAQTFDTAYITPENDLTSSIKKGGIEYSTDGGATWLSPGASAEFVDFFGGVPANSKYFGTLAFTAATAVDWRIRIDSSQGATYVGSNEILFLHSAAVGARLDNVPPTLTMPASSALNAALLGDRLFGAYAFGHDDAAGRAIRLDVDLGSVQYVAGFDEIEIALAGYTPSSTDVFTSTDGVTYTWRENVAFPSNAAYKILTLAFSRIYSTRYMRFIALSTTSGWYVYEWFLYATLTPAVPPDPTSVVAKASATGTDIGVTWSEIAGDDNLLADIVFDITRQKNGGGYASIATGVVAQTYVDKSLAAGSYDYKVQARNLYHARTSSAVQSSASVTSPAAAGGGGGAADGSRRYDPREVLC